MTLPTGGVARLDLEVGARLLFMWFLCPYYKINSGKSNYGSQLNDALNKFPTIHIR